MTSKSPNIDFIYGTKTIQTILNDAEDMGAVFRILEGGEVQYRDAGSRDESDWYRVASDPRALAKQIMAEG